MSGRKAASKQLQFRAGAIGFIGMAGVSLLVGASAPLALGLGVVVAIICYHTVA